MGRSHYGLATVARQSGHFEQAQHHLELSQRHFEACLCQRGIADCLNMLGDLCRIRGQLAPAEEHYRESIRRYKAIGAGDNHVCEVNLALVLLYRNKFSEARQALERALETFTQNSSRMLQGAAHLCLLPCLAHSQEWDAWHHHIEIAQYLIETSNFFDIDLAEVAFLAGNLSEQAKAYAQAHDAYHIASRQWKILERTDKVTLVEKHLTHVQSYLPQGNTVQNTIPEGISEDWFEDPNGPTQRSNAFLDEHTLSPELGR